MLRLREGRGGEESQGNVAAFLAYLVRQNEQDDCTAIFQFLGQVFTMQTYTGIRLCYNRVPNLHEQTHTMHLLHSVCRKICIYVSWQHMQLIRLVCVHNNLLMDSGWMDGWIIQLEEGNTYMVSGWVGFGTLASLPCLPLKSRESGARSHFPPYHGHGDCTLLFPLE